MKLRALTFILACSCGLPAMAAERPNVPLTRPNVVTREAPVVRDTTARPMPTFRVAPSDLPRGNIVRPDVGAVRPILPSDARLSFASRAQFFTEYKGERVLIAEASGFAPDTTYADLNIVYKDDLHPFLTEDGLMDLIIRVEPNGWYPARHDLILITTTATISFDL